MHTLSAFAYSINKKNNPWANKAKGYNFSGHCIIYGVKSKTYVNVRKKQWVTEWVSRHLMVTCLSFAQRLVNPLKTSF